MSFFFDSTQGRFIVAPSLDCRAARTMERGCAITYLLGFIDTSETFKHILFFISWQIHQLRFTNVRIKNVEHVYPFLCSWFDVSRFLLCLIRDGMKLWKSHTYKVVRKGKSLGVFCNGGLQNLFRVNKNACFWYGNT